MSNQNQNRKPPRDPMVLDDSKLRLYGKPIQEGAYAPSLRLKKIENNPCFEVDCGFKSDKGYPQKIEAPMDPAVLSTLLVLIEKVAAYPNEISFEIENWGHPFIWDNEAKKSVRSKDRLVISKTQVAKRADGAVTIALAAKRMPVVEFVFEPSEFHPMLQNGQPCALKLSSPTVAAGWAQLVRDVFNTNFTNTWVEPEYAKRKRLERMQNAQNRQQGGGGGGYNNNRQQGGGGGGYQQQQQQAPRQQQPQADFGGESFDDDLPF